MRTIWKFGLEIKELQTLRMPKGAEILSVGNQRESLQLWVMVETDNQLKDRTFEILTTGSPVPYTGMSRQYLGTVVIDPFVWHVFERVM